MGTAPWKLVAAQIILFIVTHVRKRKQNKTKQKAVALDLAGIMATKATTAPA